MARAFYDRTAMPRVACLYLTFSLLPLVGCHGSKVLSRTSDAASPRLEAETTQPHILFVDILIEKNEDGEQEVRLHQLFLAEGRLKRDEEGAEEKGDLLCSFFDAEGQLLKRKVVENPLFRRYEYIDDEERGFQQALVERDEGNLLVRTVWQDGMAYVRVEERVDSTTLREIGTLSLKL